MKTLPNIETIKDIQLLENLGIDIDFSPEEEDAMPEDSFCEEETIELVREKYNNGNLAAWFCAKVTVSYKDMLESDYLGCCSYGSFKEFTTEENGYYVDMINTCINEINRQIESINFGPKNT